MLLSLLQSMSDIFSPFCDLISGIMTDELRNFLELNLPKVKDGKKAKFSLGVAEPKIGSHIFEVTKIPCQSNEFILELLRGVRLHFDRFIKDLKVVIYFFSFSCFPEFSPFPFSAMVKNNFVYCGGKNNCL